MAPATTISTVVATATALIRPFVDYKTLSFPDSRDVLPDYSYAGYRASGDPLPSKFKPATYYMSPTLLDSDRSQELQAALDLCSADGGGVIELEAGDYVVASDTLQFTSSNCVLRGVYDPSGIKVNLVMRGAQRSFLNVGSPTAATAGSDFETSIVSEYVGVGARQMQVQDPSGLMIGQTVFVQRRASREWIAAMGMDQLVRSGSKQTWIGAGRLLQQPRTIIQIEGDVITLDVPLTDAVNKAYDSGRIIAYTAPVVYSEIGIENIKFVREPDNTGLPITLNDLAIAFQPWVRDAWVRNVHFFGFNAMVNVPFNASKITIAQSVFERALKPDSSSGWSADIGVNGGQLLVSNCTTINYPGSRNFETTEQSTAPGPSVQLNHITINAGGVEPHQRWSTGFLLDNSTATSAKLWNRGNAGTGQGWTCGASVLWNVKSNEITVQRPPLSQNFCVGCLGKHTSSTGSTLYNGVPVQPQSLFAAQLEERIGAERAQAVLAY